MARRPVPSFTPDQLELIQKIQQNVINNVPPPAPKPVPIEPQPGGMGMQGGKAGGFWYQNGGRVMDNRKRVSDSEDTGMARARADQASIAQGEADFGRNNSSVRNALGTRAPTFDKGWEGGVHPDRISPLIKVYNKGGMVKHGSKTRVTCKEK